MSFVSWAVIIDLWMKFTFVKMLYQFVYFRPYTYSQCMLQICSTAEKEMIDMIIDKGPQLAGLLNSTVLHSESLYSLRHVTQGFMQDQIIASHTCFGGHVDVNC